LLYATETTTFAAGATMTTAIGTATSILAPATEGTYKLYVIDAAGNYSTASTATLTVDTTPPVASAPTSTAQILKSGDVSTSTVQSTEAGNIYLVKTETSATTQALIDSAVTANTAFLGKSAAVADTPYTITVAESLVDGLYDIVAVDNYDNVSSACTGWLTVDNTAPAITSITSTTNPAGDSITVTHTAAGGVAPVDKTVTYGTVLTNLAGPTATTYRRWITQNLGATNQATSADDATEPSAGWYWQFNRKQGFKHDTFNCLGCNRG